MRINNRTCVLLLLLMHLCSCQLGLFLRNYYENPTAYYQCLATKGYKKIATITEKNPGYLDSFFGQWIKAKNVGLDMDLMFYPCRPFYASDYIEQMMEYMPRGFDGTIWINPYTVTGEIFSSCVWKAEDGYEENCAQLRIYLKALKQRGVKVGIADSKYVWNQVFGNSCKDLGTEKLLWLSNEETQDFDSFKPFGGWTKPAMKKFNTMNQVCGRYQDYLYFES